MNKQRWKRLLRTIDIDVQEQRAILERTKTGPLTDEDRQTLESGIRCLEQILKELRRTRTTEKSDQVLPPAPESSGSAEESPASPAPPAAEPGKTKKPGHGRNGVDDYPGAEWIEVPHESLKPGDCCPACKKGRVYRHEAAVPMRMTGQAPVRGKAYRFEQLRCNRCDTVFTATGPPDAYKPKYDESAAAMIALLRYGNGMPAKRLEQLQKSLGIPLPTSTQWDLCQKADQKIKPAVDELIRQAAQGDVLYNDDTSMRVLALNKKSPEQDDGVSPKRTGVFTTGIVSTNDQHGVALFFTGRNHAGENLATVLKERDPERPPPIQMCDGLSRNLAKAFAVILANCLAHGRRHFVNTIDDFPEASRFVIEALAKVYHNDELAKERGLSKDERLRFHQAESGPIMEELKSWLKAKLDDRLVEPNSSLGKAIQYLLKRWDKLTLFLRVPGAPLDSNIVERALKMAIRHRRNSLFYKTLNGAEVGDHFQSLIHSAKLAKANPLDYLTQLLRHHKEVAAHPERWMPWNYRQAVESVAPG